MNTPPLAVTEALSELGALISAARRERGLTQRDLQERLGVSRMTVHRIEKGAPEVGIGAYLTAAWILGLPVLSFADFATARHTSVVGTFLERLQEQLPTRVRPPEPVDDDF